MVIKIKFTNESFKMFNPTKTPKVDLVELVRNLIALSDEQLAIVAKQVKAEAGRAAMTLKLSAAIEESAGFEQGQEQAGRHLNGFCLRDKFTEPYYYNKLQKIHLNDHHLPPPASDFSVASGIAELRQQRAQQQAELLTQARERGVTKGIIAGPKKENLIKGLDIELSREFRDILKQIKTSSKPRFDLTDLRHDEGSAEMPDFLKKTL
jgi:hypothetical protein